MPFFLCTSSVCFPFRRSLIWKCWWDDFPLPLSFLGFRHQKRMFSCRELYVFPGGNLRFPRGRHRKCRESLKKMCLRCEYSGALFVMPPVKITAFMMGWRFRFLRFRAFFSVFSFRAGKFRIRFFRVSAVFYADPVCIFAFPLLHLCIYVRTYAPARNT